jgi:hypothetical protein
MSSELIISILVALGGAGGISSVIAVFVNRKSKRQTEADIVASTTDNSIKLQKAALDFADGIQKRLNECQLDISRLRIYASKLAIRLDENGIDHTDIVL